MVNTITQMPSDKTKEYKRQENNTNPQEEQVLTTPDTCQAPHKAQTTVKSSDQKYRLFWINILLFSREKESYIRTDVHPVMQPLRRIPYHMRKEVGKELAKLVKQDIIEKVVDQPTPWISPVVCTRPKKDGGIRLCVDMRAANQEIERERHIMPTIQDCKAEVNGSKYFSKINLKQAYHQLELAPESQYITTFSTHEGLYRYKRLNYGTSSAAEIFQNVLQRNLSDIRGVKNIADDIIVHGKNTERP